MPAYPHQNPFHVDPDQLQDNICSHMTACEDKVVITDQDTRVALLKYENHVTLIDERTGNSVDMSYLALDHLSRFLALKIIENLPPDLANPNSMMKTLGELGGKAPNLPASLPANVQEVFDELMKKFQPPNTRPSQNKKVDKDVDDNVNKDWGF